MLWMKQATVTTGPIRQGLSMLPAEERKKQARSQHDDGVPTTPHHVRVSTIRHDGDAPTICPSHADACYAIHRH